ncbi:MAG TPA: MarR family transcriptional regulator [Nocardioidaceae bacterium]|nr:MarR family transcriptional regulator [Nocardioidaceae bacterium]
MEAWPSDPLSLERQVCYGLSIASRGVIAAYKPFLDPLGLTHPQYLVMVGLWQHGTLTVKDLGALLSLNSGTLSPLLKRLETTGLVTRQRSAADERQVTVALTERGTLLRERAIGVQKEVEKRLGLTQDELARLQAVLTRVSQAVAAPARVD